MKKFHLSIPKPCHENWDQMTQAEKGRFCGACQKTVIDFTNMSDREMATFFKKPMGSVCGRFHQDQLNREIAIPKKRIPWLRYFFHIAWPAFILMLKSCGSKERVIGEPATSLSVHNGGAKEGEVVGVMMGKPLPIANSNMLPIDVKGEVAAVGTIEPLDVMGIIEEIPVDEQVQVQDSITCRLPLNEPDTAIISGLNAYNRLEEVMGDVAYILPEKIKSNQAVNQTPNANNNLINTVLAYPNPVRPGEVLNVKLSGNDNYTPVSLQLLTTTGQRVMHKALKSTTHLPAIPIQLPNNLSAGVYYVQIQFADGSIDKSTIIVNR